MVRKKTTKTTKPVKPVTRLPAYSADVPPLHWLVIRGARQHNLKGIDVPFPLGAFSVVTGVSGSGKSSLINDILWKTLARVLHRAQTVPGAHSTIEGVEFINKVIRVDQQPIGQTPTSNPATYTGVFDIIREYFARLPEAKVSGYTARRFSFNVPGGRCEKCEGAGQIKIEMHFLPDVWITCDSCGGKRYEPQTLNIKYKGHSIADVLEMSCSEALQLFENIPEIRRILKTLCDVGLDYLALGQPAPTLSGGEAQRIKLATELARPDTGRTLYLLDEPTTGLHFNDLKKLLEVLHRLVDIGNTVIVIEHNLDVIKNADWLVDLGPEAGQDGGYLVFAGIPEEIAKDESQTANKRTKSSRPLSHTAAALIPVLTAGPFEERKIYHPADIDGNSYSATSSAYPAPANDNTKMPWETNGPRWHTKDRVNRKGGAIRWDGRILSEVVRHIEDSNIFAPTDWNDRSVVEIRAEKKQLGWFFHAITAEEWLLKMKFRTARNTFRKETLIAKLDLKPLNEMDAIPLYGTEPRVRILRSGNAWQEIELRAHSFDEINRQEFWDFLGLAIQSFAQFTKKVENRPEDLMPWKILGEKWHFLPRGLNGGSKLFWEYSLLTEIFGIIKGVAPLSRTVWTNKSLVPIYGQGKTVKQDGAAQRTLPWVVVHTKRVDAVYVEIYTDKNTIPLGRIRSLGIAPQVLGENLDYDILQFKFSQKNDINKQELQTILRETLKR